MSAQLQWESGRHGNVFEMVAIQGIPVSSRRHAYCLAAAVHRSFFAACAILASQFLQAADFDSPVAMHRKDSNTFYVSGSINGSGHLDFLIDTGSGYVTLDQDTLAALQRANPANVEYRRKLVAVLADNRERTVSVYRVADLDLGANCHLGDIEVAVLPGRGHPILGLSALLRAAPFAMDPEAGQLRLSNCATALSASLP
jgi:predicted aspartyl protease